MAFWQELLSFKGALPFRGVEALTTARNNYLAASRANEHLPSFGIRWGQLREELEGAISKFKSSAEAIRFAQTRGIYDHRERMTRQRLPKIKVAQHLLEHEYPEFWAQVYLFKETRATTPGYGIKVQAPWGGKMFVSDILYFHASFILTCLRFRRDIDSVCEVGGGYGNPAFQWLTNPVKPVSRYCIVDMPESLFFSEIYLRTALPELSVHYATESSPPSVAPGITLVPVALSGQTKNVSFDVVTNTGSMAEMTDEWLSYYPNWLDQQNTKLFYSHNYMANSPEGVGEAPTTLAPVVSSNWRPVYVRPKPPIMLLQTKARLSSEIIFERTQGRDRQDVGAILEFFEGVKLRLENYVHCLYAILRDLEANSDHIMNFAQKVISDFGYAPVELIYLLSQGDQSNKDLVSLHDELSRRAAAKYEDMTPATRRSIFGFHNS
jgi:putative sugar O-methyltransferase